MCGNCSVQKVCSPTSGASVRVCTGCYNCLYYTHEDRLPRTEVLNTSSKSIKRSTSSADVALDDPSGHKDAILTKSQSAAPSKSNERTHDDDKLSRPNKGTLLGIQTMLENKQVLLDNIEREKIIEEKTSQMTLQATTFAETARKLKEQERQKGWFFS